ncbi:hypothetical protein PILCRDRAFT_810119 [Piloderma croceum F 1598]|uniref:Uncharacterized protein n=1 Tax=Piloderma croceum (strain F 1598) TaxID=765440 RepID=A0A0C3G7C9_PILCF|nr:hypothetical protein PILCRDRAFT_810119 [Piloderma croceum F 1598]
MNGPSDSHLPKSVQSVIIGHLCDTENYSFNSNPVHTIGISPGNGPLFRRRLSPGCLRQEPWDN